MLVDNSLAIGFHHNQDESPAVLMSVVILEDEDVSLCQTHDMEDELFNALIVAGSKRIEELNIDFKFHPEFDKEVIASQGHVLTCESILSIETMLKAHIMLDAEEIMVSIPRRGIMMICNKDVPDEVKNRFYNFHAFFWVSDDEFGNDKIAKDIFILKHGEIENVLYMPLDN